MTDFSFFECMVSAIKTLPIKRRNEYRASAAPLIDKACEMHTITEQERGMLFVLLKDNSSES